MAYARTTRLALLAVAIVLILKSQSAQSLAIAAPDGKNSVNRPSAELPQMEMDQISIIMKTLMPSMFGLFSNITSAEYKSQFHAPCKFDQLLEIFSKLPPYFDLISRKYPTRTDLSAYYSMQLASTFLVNNGSLTMRCLYNMISLQNRLKSFSLELMDNPEKPENYHLVGLFGYFIKPVMSKLKKNSMMKIIDEVDKYENNDDLSTIGKFNAFNVFACVLGTVAVFANVFLILLLVRTTTKTTKTTFGQPVQPGQEVTLTKRVTVKGRSKYKRVKSRIGSLNVHLRKKYTTRRLFIIIAACHSFYILVNYMLMSQASLAAVALTGLTESNVACKFAFFMSPPTTAYTIVHQLAIWLLVIGIKLHSAKLRRCKPDYGCVETAASSSTSRGGGRSDTDDSNVDTSNSDDLVEKAVYRRNLYPADDTLQTWHKSDTLSQSLTNNSQPSGGSVKPIQTVNMQKTTVHFSSSSHSNTNRLPIVPRHAETSSTTFCGSSQPLQPLQITYYQRHHVYSYPASRQQQHSSSIRRTKCKSPNKLLVSSLVLVALLVVYNAQNFFLYKLNELETDKDRIFFCAYNDHYASLFTKVNQLVPLLNLLLFSIAPLVLMTVFVLSDVCFIIRLKREQMKRFEHLRDLIEWPLYVYYVVYFVSQMPYAVHQLVDVCLGSVKFPFVFPLFIQMKFSRGVWWVLVEQTLILVAYSSDLFIWLAADRNFRELACYWLNKQLLCRTYSNKDKAASLSDNSSTSSSNSRSGGKTSSDSSVINDESAVTRSGAGLPLTSKLPMEAANGGDSLTLTKPSNLIRPQSYASSTLTSTSSSGTKKKQLSSNVLDGIKASAALPASIQLNSQYPYENTMTSLANQQQRPSSIRMIDTDNDEPNETCLLVDQKAKGLNRLSENDIENKLSNITANIGDDDDDDDEPDMDEDILDYDEEIKYKSYPYHMDSNPPSFKSATKRNTLKKTETSPPPPPTASSVDHQYQNDHFELDITSTNNAK